jgi:cytochrome c-type biogenesis protein CcmF
MDMGKYTLTYLGDSAHPKKQLSYYKIHFRSKDGKEEFTLMPNSFVNYKGNEGLMSNPDARHYWDHDVFTYITSISNPDSEKDTATFKATTLMPGDSVFYSNGFIVADSVRATDSLPEKLFGKDGRLYEVPLKVYSKTGSIYSVDAKLAIARGESLPVPDTIVAESLVLRLDRVSPDGSIGLGVKESNAVMKYITLKAYKFPFINLLWFGVAITAIGILMSMVRRIRQNRLTGSGSEI